MVKTSYTVTRFDVGYQGFYVEVTPYMQDGEEWLEFTLCKERYGMKSFMFGVKKQGCPESEWEEIIMGNLLSDGYISMFYDDMAALEESYEEKAPFEAEAECGDCCGKCENIYEAIDMHNEHVEDMQDLAEALLKQYPCIEETPVNDVFCKAFDSMKGPAIFLCCEMNEFEEDQGWMVTDDGYVVHEDECECDGDCEHCPMDK